MKQAFIILTVIASFLLIALVIAHAGSTTRFGNTTITVFDDGSTATAVRSGNMETINFSNGETGSAYHSGDTTHYSFSNGNTGISTKLDENTEVYNFNNGCSEDDLDNRLRRYPWGGIDKIYNTKMSEIPEKQQQTEEYFKYWRSNYSKRNWKDRLFTWVRRLLTLIF